MLNANQLRTNERMVEIIPPIP